ncbi:hypothetical protein BJX99DRAFT_204204 [Aspergillus californicus]
MRGNQNTSPNSYHDESSASETTTAIESPEHNLKEETEAEKNSKARQSLAESLVTRCRTLLAEFDAFKALLTATQRNPQTVEVRSLRSNILSELKTLEKLSAQLEEAVFVTNAARERDGDPSQNAGTGTEVIEAEDAELRVVHALKSSNLPFYEAVWTIAKRTCTGLVAFGKRFYWETDVSAKNTANKNKDKRKSVFVDIVADDGEEWVKVSTISETRLLFEMAKKGWEADSEDEEGKERTVLQNHDLGEDGDNYENDNDDDDEIELLKLASDMRKAASLVRVNYGRPRLRFVIPKVEEGQSPEIDDLLKAIRGHGVVVDCGDGAYTSRASSNGNTGISSTQGELQNLLPNRFKRFTSTLNVDCTLLLAIISDLSHYESITPSSIHHKAINRQIEIERERPLLSTELWPAMESHELVCTSEAAKRMREIVETIGTETEQKRMAILMGNHPYDDAKSASLVGELQMLSDHQIPSQMSFPIKIVDVKPAIDSWKGQGPLPLFAEKVEEILSDINTSVFMYGWALGIMTITSNRTVVKQMETVIERHRGDQDFKWPLIWVCDTARSLIGKEKGRKS